MNAIQKLSGAVSLARKNYTHQIEKCTEAQAQWKPAPEIWSVAENTEHLFWAEQGGICGMWKTIHAIRAGKIERRSESVHQDMTIEQTIDLPGSPKKKHLR